MRIWGYILIVLNIAGAATFIYFATQIWKARTEWQLALVRQQLAIDGLPLEAPPKPDHLNEGSVPFSLQVGQTHIDQIKESVLKNAIPAGGTVLGGTKLVTDQTEEVKRVHEVVFAALTPDKKISLPKLNEDGSEAKDGTGKVIMEEHAFLSPEKRQRLLATLISLAKGSNRMGAYALLRDLRTYELVEEMDKPAILQPVPDLGRYERARRELKYLGRTDPQVSTLDLLEAIGKVQEALTLQFEPDVVKQRAYVARVAVARWLRTEIPHAAPDAFRSPNAPPPTADNPLPKNEARELLEGKLRPLIDSDEDGNDPLNFTLPKEVEESLKELNKDSMRMGKKEKPVVLTTLLKNFPKGYLLKFKNDEMQAKNNRAEIDKAVKELRDQVGAETGLNNPEAAKLVPFMADLAGNPLDTKENLEAARKRLIELLDLRSTSAAEKKANAAIAEILFATKPFAAEKDQAKIQRELQIDIAALETLRAYFEEAQAPSSATVELPADVAAARSKLAGIKPIRDPGQKRRDIAHLLYHLDGYLAIDFVKVTDKTIDGAKVQAYDGNIGARVRWFKLMFPAIAPDDPNDEALGQKEKDEAAKKLDQVHKERAEWHRRVAAIVGLEAYVKAIEAQASELAMITTRLRPIVAEEQGYFLKNREEYITWLIELNKQVDGRLRVEKEEKDLNDKWKTDLASRQGEEQALRNDLSKAQMEAKTALTDLEKKVQELFLVTRKLGEAQDALLGLELQLREIELGRKR